MPDDPVFVCFGELLLRLGAPGRELLLQTPRFEAFVGGAEANVAASLACLGRRARMASVAPDNALGEAALGDLRRRNVDVSAVMKAEGRMGLYFYSAGAVTRPSRVLYDRAGSAFAVHPEDRYDWKAILEGARWLHVSGITPAVSANAAAAAIAACEAARAQGVKVSFDGNYRAQLWKAWRGDGPAVLKRILSQADLAFIDERDLALILGRSFEGESIEARRAAAHDAAFAAFPNLGMIASTIRTQKSVDSHTIAGHVATREATFSSPLHALNVVVDRIGAGDAFAAGLLHALEGGKGLQYAADFAAAAAALKHSIPGDFNLASEADIVEAMAGNGFDVRR